MQVRKRRNRNRSRRRAIYCLIHSYHLDSVSQKGWLYTDKAEHLQTQRLGLKALLSVISSYTTVSIDNERLEAFWCEGCQQGKWYWVARPPENDYTLNGIPKNLWQQA